MAITTVAGIKDWLPGIERLFTKPSITTVAGGWFSEWFGAGEPAAGASPGNTTTGVIPTDATTGAFPFANPATALTYLAATEANASQRGTLILYDRLWHAGAFTSSNGVINATDSTPIDRDTFGAGGECWVEIATALSATATTLTITYTDQAGNTAQTGTCVVPASAIASRMFPFVLASGDYGIRSIENLNGSAAPTGTFNLVLLRKLAMLPIAVPGESVPLDWAKLGLARISDDSCIAMMMMTAANSSGVLSGSLNIIQG